MELTNNNDVIIVLNITDRRGRNIRVSAVKDIKVKVWTQDPECALTYNHRDIIQKMDCDVIRIPSRQMAALPSGIVKYQYEFKGLPDEPHHGFHPQIERCHTVTTDIFWKNNRHEDFMKNPTFYNSLDHLKELIEAECRERHHQFGDLYHYVTETYTNKLQDEVDRATNRENEIEASVNEINEKVDGNYTELNDKIDAEVKRSTEVDIHFLEIINELDAKTQDGKQETDDKIDNESQRAEEAEKEIQANVDAEVERAKAEEKRIEEKLDAEIARSKAEDTQTNLQIETEVTRAKQEEARIEARMEAEKARAQAAEKRLQSAIDDEVNRSKAADEEIDRKQIELKDAINAEADRAKKKEKKIKQSVDDETSRATIAENEIRASVEVLDSTHKAELNRLETKVDVETARATEAEKHIQSDVDDEIARAKAKETEIETLLKNHISEADADYVTKEQFKNRIEELIGGAPAAFDTLMELYEALQKDGDAIKVLNEILVTKADADVVYTKTEIDRKESDMTNVIQTEVQRATLAENGLQSQIDSLTSDSTSLTEKVNNHIADADSKYSSLNTAVSEEITRASNAEAQLQNAVDAETNRAKTEEGRIEAKVDVNADNIVSETSRAKLVEKDITDTLQALKTAVNAKDAELADSIDDVRNNLNAEVLRSETEDSRINTLIELLNADADTVGSVLHSIADAEHRINDNIEDLRHEVDEIIGGNLEDYATKVYVDERFQHLIGEAPEALDTLEEIANKLKQDDELFATIQEILSGKASKDDVYTKGEIDRQIADISNAVQTEVQRATLAENGLQSQIDGLSSDAAALLERVNKHIADGDSYYQELNALIVAETTRATNAETQLQNSIDVINGDENTIGSIAHGVADSNHYTDDKIAGLQSETTEVLKDYAKQIDLESLISTVTNHISDADSKYAELNNAIVAETTRATNAETINANAIAVINGDVDTIGSINHAVADANHYTDDEIAKLRQSVVSVEDFNSHLADATVKEAAMNQRVEAIETMLQWDEYSY